MFGLLRILFWYFNFFFVRRSSETQTQIQQKLNSSQWKLRKRKIGEKDRGAKLNETKRNETQMQSNEKRILPLAFSFLYFAR